MPLIPNYRQSQVVGRKDIASGEVPVAIISSVNQNISIEDLRQAVIDKHGIHYAPESIVRLEQLGMTEFPRTSIGKVHKAGLIAALDKYSANHPTGDRQ